MFWLPSGSLLQIGRMAGVQQIEATVGENHGLSCPAIRPGQIRHFVERYRLLLFGASCRRQFGLNLVPTYRGHAQPLHLQAGRHVGQTNRFRQVKAACLCQPENGQPENGQHRVAGPGNVVHGAGPGRDDFARMAPAHWVLLHQVLLH